MQDFPIELAVVTMVVDLGGGYPGGGYAGRGYPVADTLSWRVLAAVLLVAFMVDMDIWAVLAEGVFLSILAAVRLVVVAGIQELRTLDFRRGWEASWLDLPALQELSVIG